MRVQRNVLDDIPSLILRPGLRGFRPAVLVLAVLLSCAGAYGQTVPDSQAALRAGDLEGAVRMGLREIAADERAMDSYVALCSALLALGRYEEAMRHAGIARGINRNDPRIIELLARAYFHVGNNLEALRHFQQYINASSESGSRQFAYYYIGEIFIRMGRFRHADIALTTALYMLPGEPLWWTRLAFAREGSGDLLQAAAAYEKALELDPTLTDARRGLQRVRLALAGR